MKIAISGSHGLIGSALRDRCEAAGDTVIPLSRDLSKPVNFEGVDAVIHLGGENISQGRWTAAKKQRIRESRINGTSELAKQLAASPFKPNVFICASAIGFYGNRGDELLNEKSAAGSGFLSEVCTEWEQSVQPAIEAGIRTVNLRTGIVLAANGGALAKMAFPFKMGAGGILGNGRQYMSWITLDDEVEAIRFVMNNTEINGPVNLVSPHPVTNLEFTKTLGKALHRPTIMPLPGFAARLLFGEMADHLLLSSTRVVPDKLLEAGFDFKHGQLDQALEAVLK